MFELALVRVQTLNHLFSESVTFEIALFEGGWGPDWPKLVQGRAHGAVEVLQWLLWVHWVLG